MLYSRATFTADGTQTEFTVPFPLLRVDTLKVKVNDVLKTRGIDYTYDLATAKVTFLSAPTSGHTIVLQRITPRTESERLVIFTDPSDIRAELLNSSDLQLLFIIQEALDDISEGTGVGVPNGPGSNAEFQNQLDAIDAQLVVHNAAITGLLADVATANNALVAEVNARTAAILSEHNAWVAGVLAEATARTSAISSAVGAEASLRVAGDTAIAADLSVLSAQVNNPSTGLPAAHALVSSEASARASADSALASRVTSLESFQTTQGTTNSTLSSRITAVESAITIGGDVTALALRVTTLEATVTTHGTDIATNAAAISTEAAARASADSALATSISTVSASAAAANAAVSTETTARASADSALSASISTLTTNLGTLSSTVSTETAARTSGDSALAASIATVSSVASGAAAAVSTEASTRATETGNLSAQYVLKVSAGKVTGMRVTSVSNPAAGDTTEIVFDADAFKVFNGTTGVPPFQVSGGSVRVRNLTLVPGDVTGLGALATQNDVAYSAITGTKPPSNADVTLSAMNGGLNITGGGIIVSSSAVLKSSNYVAGTSGWSLGATSLDIKDGTFRGTVRGAEIIVTGALGMHYVDDAGVYTITGGGANGVSHGAQIDLAGTSCGGGVDGVLVLSAGNSSNGNLILRTGAAADRIVITPAGLINVQSPIQINNELRDSSGNRILSTRKSAISVPVGAGNYLGSDTISESALNTTINAICNAISQINARLKVTGGHGLWAD